MTILKVSSLKKTINDAGYWSSIMPTKEGAYRYSITNKQLGCLFGNNAVGKLYIEAICISLDKSNY